MRAQPAQPGRGTALNPAGRFESIEVVYDAEFDQAIEAELEEGLSQARKTHYLRDDSRSALVRNDSPDLNFNYSLNPYRGCEHGCSYCYARPYHEFLGMSAGLDFESKILVKENAPELLRKELSSKRWQPQLVAMSGVTDPYQPIEGKLAITRRCLEVFAEFRNPVGVITKNALVERDIDLLAELASFNAGGVLLSITTLNEDLRRRMEPRTSTAARRLEALQKLNASGIPTGVMIGPIIPGLNDEEIPAIVKAVAEAGASSVHYTMARLPMSVASIFEHWLEEHYPDRKAKVLRQIRELHQGRISSPVGERMKLRGERAERIRFVFDASRKKYAIPDQRADLSVASFRRPGMQRELF